MRWRLMFFFSLLLLTPFQMIFKWNHFSLKVGIFCLRIIFTCVHRPLCQSVCGIPPFSQNKQDNYFMANNKWRIHATWENHTHSMRAVNLLFLCVFLSSVIFFYIAVSWSISNSCCSHHFETQIAKPAEFFFF